MYEGILLRMRECVGADKFFITPHALVAIEQDLLTSADVISCLLAGEIVERQKDRKSGEYKYVIAGQAEDGSEIEVVAKLHKVGDVYVITVYRIY